MISKRLGGIFAAAFIVLIILSIAASYYKYMVIKDFESVFYIPCEEGESGCFINTYDCEEGMDIEECAYVYKAVVVNQGLLDATCSPDEGECLINTCTNSPEQCQTVYCQDPAAEHYQLSDECAE